MRKKLISFAAALAIAASALTGLTAVTASAEGPALADFDLAPVVEVEKFTTALPSEAVTTPRYFGSGYGKYIYNNAIIAKGYKNNDPSSDAVVKDTEVKITNNVLQLSQKHHVNWLTSSNQNMSASNYIYYTYETIAYGSGNKSDHVSILLSKTGEGYTSKDYEEKKISNLTAVTSTANLDNGTESAHKYTTIINKTSHIAYTYNESNVLIDTLDLGEENDVIEGIRINGHDSGHFYNVHSMVYGVATEHVTPEHVTPEFAPGYDLWKPNTAEYSENFANTTLANDEIFPYTYLRNNGWEFSANKDFTLRSEPAAVSFAWNKKLTNTKKTDGGYFYYKYTIQMSRELENSQLVRLVTESHDASESLTTETASGADTTYAIVSAPAAYSKTEKFTYTTFVDADNKVAYTYNSAKELIKISDYHGDTLKGIQFATVMNTNVGSYYVYDFEYGTAELNAKYEGQFTGTDDSTATAYSAEFILDNAKAYKNPVMSWTIEPSATSQYTGKTKKISTDPGATITNSASVKYGLVIEEGEADAKVTPEFEAEVE